MLGFDLYEIIELDDLAIRLHIAGNKRFVIMAAPKPSHTAEVSPHAGAAASSFTTKLRAQADFKKVLLERYQEAVARSRKIGHRVSFRVEVDPGAGAQTITPVEEQLLADDFPVDDTKPDGELEAALSAARDRGRKRVAEIVAGEDMLSAEALARLLGTSRVTVNSRRQSGQLLGVDGAKRGFRFPVWQLDKDGRPFEALPVLHEMLGNAWAVYRFLVLRHGALEGLTGLQALQRGDDDAVLSAAEGMVRGDFD